MEASIYELGFHLRSAYWGQGIAFKAATAVIHYAFDKLGASDIFVGRHPDNMGSEKVLNKLGFHYIGKEFYAPTGLMHPSYRYKVPEKK